MRVGVGGARSGLWSPPTPSPEYDDSRDFYFGLFSWEREEEVEDLNGGLGTEGDPEEGQRGNGR